MGFVALETAVALIEGLGEVVKRIEARDRSLADQMQRAANSIALNIAEGAERRGRDRAHSFRVASGSAAELRTALRVAVAWRHVPADSIEPALDHLYRLRGLLYGLTR
jgi:four helix bundle protein